ncbi:hypothetical protein O6H91_06G068900 [Diphasiastrum complanatum]|uniref:Uncharacterized protein n=1 Tax=Diphasiastrum complanatum TaxID=34168 RepID=A0ACC2DEJ0_DIPCM|nr:hypothetical protein O6H91_06G068900 [Diphasiastrum complanatum]
MESAPTPATSNSTSTSDASEGSSNQPNRINLSAQQLLAHEDDDQLMPIMHALGWMAWDLVDGFREYVKFPAHGDRNKVNIVKLTSPVHFATKQDRQEVFREMRTFTQLLGEVGDGSELRIKLVKEPGPHLDVQTSQPSSNMAIGQDKSVNLETHFSRCSIMSETT